MSLIEKIQIAIETGQTVVIGYYSYYHLIKKEREIRVRITGLNRTERTIDFVTDVGNEGGMGLQVIREIKFL